MDELIEIPVDLIEMDALPRDRSQTDEEADKQLYMSILLDGLRQPIEVWRKGERYGLIAGHRRLATFKDMATSSKLYTKIPAFIRTPETVPQAMADMIAENEIRANISPWDRARIVVDACEEGIFQTPDEAVKALHPRADDRKRTRLRATVMVVETFRDTFPDPHSLSERKLLRLGATIRAGLADMALDAISRHRPKTTDEIWKLIAPIIDESEQVLAGAPRLKQPYAPRRMVQAHSGIHIRREYRPDGWALILTGPRADGVLAAQVLDEVIRWLKEE